MRSCSQADPSAALLKSARDAHNADSHLDLLQVLVTLLAVLVDAHLDLEHVHLHEGARA